MNHIDEPCVVQGDGAARSWFNAPWFVKAAAAETDNWFAKSCLEPRRLNNSESSASNYSDGFFLGFKNYNGSTKVGMPSNSENCAHSINLWNGTGSTRKQYSSAFHVQTPSKFERLPYPNGLVRTSSNQTLSNSARQFPPCILQNCIVGCFKEHVIWEVLMGALMDLEDVLCHLVKFRVNILLRPRLLNLMASVLKRKKGVLYR